MLLKILGGVLALALGIYLGMAGKYDRPMDEVERALDESGRRRRTKRIFTPLDLLHKKERGSRRRRTRSPFKTAAPDRGDRDAPQ